MPEVKRKTKRKTSTKSSIVTVDVIIDTREQKPWEFKKLPSNFEVRNTYIDTLPAGDYSIVGYDLPNDCYGVLIERKKDLIEFIGNIGNKKSWERFQRELEIMSNFKSPHIIIADDLSEGYKRYRTKYGRDRYFNVVPEFILNRIAEIQLKFGVSTHLMSNRSLSCRYACNLFKNAVLMDRKLDE